MGRIGVGDNGGGRDIDGGGGGESGMEMSMGWRMVYQAAWERWVRFLRVGEWAKRER